MHDDHVHERRDLGHDPFSDRRESGRQRAGVVKSNRTAGIASRCQVGVERHRPDQGDSDLVCKALSTAGAEDLIGPAVAAGEAGHVLYHTGDADMALACHVGCPTRDPLSCFVGAW